MRAIVFVCLAALAACDSPSNTQYVPVGSRCGKDGDCGTSPFTCNLQLPAGYCTKACPGGDGECPMDSKCMLTMFGNQCRRVCTGPTDCRVSPDGFACKSAPGVSGTYLVCEFF